jgi:hypothetical protein
MVCGLKNGSGALYGGFQPIQQRGICTLLVGGYRNSGPPDAHQQASLPEGKMRANVALLEDSGARNAVQMVRAACQRG